jgi:hypothetical protein
MRTKTLILSALLGVAASPLFAQTSNSVYSVNAVGYVQTVLNPGIYQMICNPLNATNNTVAGLMSAPPNQTVIYKWNGTGYDSSSYRFGNWSVPGMTLNPGEGCFIKTGGSIGGTPFTNTFVGEVKQGSLTNVLNPGFTMTGSQVPQAGGLQTVLGLTPANGEIVYQWDPVNQAYFSRSYRFGNWSPSEPILAVGEGFFYQSANGNTWSRSFSVNN